MVATLLPRLRRAAEIVSAALFAAMFFAFVLQVVSRYVFDAPISWTLEVCSISYIWIVFFAGATIVRPQQHITFDMLYGALPPGWQRLFAIFTTGCVLILFVICLPGTVEYVHFVSRKATLILDLRLDLVYSCFLIFMIGTIAFSALRLRVLFSRRWGDGL
jgi:TRAP-type C4-dicarboxylate transport system permease small subunit